MRGPMSIKTVLIAALVSLAGCAGVAPPQEARTEAPGLAPEPAMDSKSVVQGSTQFGIDLYRQLAAKGENVFLSPTSLSTAFGLAYAGARGETAEEMRRVLHYPAGDGAHAQLGALGRQLSLDLPGRRLSVSNALWVQSGFPVKPSYTGLLAQHYSAQPRTVDFVRQPEAAVAAVNRWVSESTAGKIPSLLERSDVNALTRLALVNAVYLKADWLQPFDRRDTGRELFYPHGLPGPSPAPGGMKPPVQMNFMTQSGSFRFIQNPSGEPRFAAVELPYVGDELSMAIFLPGAPVGGLQELERALTAEKLHGWLDALRKSDRRTVLLEIIKMKMERRYPLKEDLKAIGMRRAFTEGQADFSGITDAVRLLIDRAIHQTFVQVDEKGTEAAAATAGMMRGGRGPAGPGLVFRTNHPFFFVIRDDRSGGIIFMGSIRDPAAVKV